MSGGDDDDVSWARNLFGDEPIPCFDSLSESAAFCSSAYASASNSHSDAMRQIVSVLVNRAQLQRLLLDERQRLNQQRQPQTEVDVDDDVAKRFDGTDVLRGFRERLQLPIYSTPSDKSVENTLFYLFEHMRSGIFVKIHAGKLAMFVPFANVDYRNSWSSKLRLEPRFADFKAFYAAYERLYSHIEFLPDPSHWWSNGGVICNVASAKVWGDHGLAPLRNLLVHLCRERSVRDCEFFVNKRDWPQLKRDVTEPFNELFDSHTEPLKRHAYTSYAPICSFFSSAEFADLPFPSADDWLIATGKVFPAEHDLFASCNRHSLPPWEQRVKTAFFRGSATGIGVSIDTNQRLHLASLSHEWANDPRFSSDNPVDGVAFLDAGITSWNPRSKKAFGQPLRFLEHDHLPFGLVESVPLAQSVAAFRYHVYVAGHSGATRLAYLLRIGALVLLVEPPSSTPALWYRTLLKPMHDFVPVCADLSDLSDRIQWCKEHDDECRAIAEQAQKTYERFLSRDAILDYCSVLLNAVASRVVKPADDSKFHVVEANDDELRVVSDLAEFFQRRQREKYQHRTALLELGVQTINLLTRHFSAFAIPNAPWTTMLLTERGTFLLNDFDVTSAHKLVDVEFRQRSKPDRALHRTIVRGFLLSDGFLVTDLPVCMGGPLDRRAVSQRLRVAQSELSERADSVPFRLSFAHLFRAAHALSLLNRGENLGLQFVPDFDVPSPHRLPAQLRWIGCLANEHELDLFGSDSLAYRLCHAESPLPPPTMKTRSDERRWRRACGEHALWLNTYHQELFSRDSLQQHLSSLQQSRKRQRTHE